MLTTTRVIGRAIIGKVVGVIDDDTIEVLHSQRPERIRLSSIDCPEKGQVFGN
jgi:micrococcal nuclease